MIADHQQVSSKTLIFSDTHLGHAFDAKKFEYLRNSIAQADKVIINGDFWDYYLTTWQEFLDSPWQQLFPLLKSKQTVYIYGNHDQQWHSDDRANLFSDHQAYEYKLKVGDSVLNIQHGHHIFQSLELVHPVLRKRAFVKPAEKVEEVLVALMGKKFLELAYQSQNDYIIKYGEKNLSQNEILVCGHTHLAAFNLGKQFINTGFVRYGMGQGLMVNGEKLEMIDTRY